MFKEIDFVLPPGRFTLDRMANFYYSDPIQTVPVNVLIKYPTVEPDISGFTKPFSYEVEQMIYLL